MIDAQFVNQVALFLWMPVFLLWAITGGGSPSHLGNGAGGLLSFVLIVAAWGYKARLEERAMLEQFGAEYERYRREVKGLIPFVW